ncbi:O-antigen ligase family protein [Halomonas getboli]|uniref:O-antigen ligase family protein n=1 Tax=Halomonas getboli TaxID=2935862 RepID=UPI001FFEAB34|nr:O-antigen ligase family protein [Halomonas getboli]MCK2183054.1 O-antigen ligase family protein [Halomonas getboli]
MRKGRGEGDRFGAGQYLSPARCARLGVAMAGALPLVVPLGGWLALGVLALGGLRLLTARSLSGLPLSGREAPWERREFAIGLPFLGLALAEGLTMLVHGVDGHGLGVMLAALLALPALMLLRVLPPSPLWWWRGVALGGVSCGVFAAWQGFVEGDSRPEGFFALDPILFGNLALLNGLLCLAGLGGARGRERGGMRGWLLAGAVGGLLASGLAGSRGGWLALPLALWIYPLGHVRQGRRLTWRHWLAWPAGMVLVAGSLYLVPATGVQSRLAEAVTEVEAFVTRPAQPSSVSTRVALWEGGLRLALERPWLGQGHDGFAAGMQRLTDEGRITVDADLGGFWHAHQDLIDAWARRGALAALSVLALLGTPLVLCRPRPSREDAMAAALRTGLLLVPGGYLIFGLTYSFLAYPDGVVVYALWLLVPWGLLRDRSYFSFPATPS